MLIQILNAYYSPIYSTTLPGIHIYYLDIGFTAAVLLQCSRFVSYLAFVRGSDHPCDTLLKQVSYSNQTTQEVQAQLKVQVNLLYKYTR